MLRVWMLLVVGAAALRPAAEDVSAHSTMKEEWNKEDEEGLRRAVKKVAKKNFPEKERQHLTKAVMEAFKNAVKEMSGKEQQRYWKKSTDNGKILQSMREEYLRRAVKEVAEQHFPEKELYRLTETVMEAFRRRELDKDWNEIAKMDQKTQQSYLLRTMNRLRELPVAASAVKFCSELFREANRAERQGAIEAAKQEFKKAEKICHKVLTGELGADDGPEWAEKAANSSQPEGQHYQLGRLQKVNATEKAWKVSLKNVCKDECHELAKEMRKKSWRIFSDVVKSWNPPSLEEACAKRVVQKVEAEILGCCAESCGWNGRACMYWPFLSSTEKGQWEAECCTELNILAGSSRATMCDATLTGNEKQEVIRDGQPNTEEERKMIGQDPVGRGTSFLQEEDTNGPTPLPEYKPIPTAKGTCPPPLDLGEVHAKLKKEWKTTAFPLARTKFTKYMCAGKEQKDSIGNCTAFLPRDKNGPYMCYGHCLVSGEGLKFTNLTAEIPSNSQLLYVHETIW